jgi:hypothetical protein
MINPDTLDFTQSPLAALTLIAAPAILTNATSTLAHSTLNRMFRTRDRMSELFLKSEAKELPGDSVAFLLEQVSRAERQAKLLLGALHSIYIALGAFAGATLITLVAGGLASVVQPSWFNLLASLGIVLGIVGVGGLVFGSAGLFKATRMSLDNIQAEAAIIRRRQSPRGPATSAEPTIGPGPNEG